MKSRSVGSLPKQIAVMGMLTALSSALSFLEWLLPPVPGLPPGVKLGLANVVVMFTAFSLGRKNAYTLSLLKSSSAQAQKRAEIPSRAIYNNDFFITSSFSV